MDEYTTKMATSFLDELSQIEKRAGPLGGLGRLVTGGIQTLGRLGAKGAKKVTLRGLHRHGSMAFRRAGGGLQGAKAYMKAPAGQALTTAGLGALSAYGGYKALGG